MVDTSEKDFEAFIEAGLITGGYVKRSPDQYDRELCLDPGPLFDFIYASQPQTWEKLKTQHGDLQVKERFLARLVKEIQARGALDVFHKGITDLGCHFDLAYFRPETGFNEEHRRKYNANIFSIMRQVKYSTKNEKSLDLVIFLNGLPIMTAELKNPLKGQNVQNGVKQYKYDRDPKEPLFQFGRCLVHFSVDTDLVYMTTQLKGGGTAFLPFNQGWNGGAGNPEREGFKTAYLWEEVWGRDSLLEIIDHFLRMVELEDEKGRKTGQKALIFPRYHQLDAVRRMVVHSKANGPGNNYLVQHSAGSGKSNSIAWLAHRLSSLHDENDQKVFDSIIIITDRRVLDRQLRNTVRSFEQVKGIVDAITKHKSKELARALEQGSSIIVTTLQTFPFVTEKIGEIPGRRFAVIIDEAHSSQSGETSKSMKEVLAVRSIEDAEDEDAPTGPDEEDSINQAVEAEMKKRGRIPNVSFFAFTATPKNKTLELFGSKLSDGSFMAFSLYTMRQAIEEQFILDVLKNYTTFKVYFALLKRIEDDPRYPRKKGTYLLKSYVDLHEHNLNKKTAIIVDHLHEQVRERIGGKAKAMVVTRSRLHAVRYKLAFDKYLREKKYPYKVLVAFSGTVRDPDTGEEFTEVGMNGFPESQTAAMFKRPENRILIVAEKFQTGFDQPLLHTMYVDKKLEGVHAVQTLSRLNRIHDDKEEAMVLDFVNRADDIADSFKPYYEATYLSEETDPNKLYDLKRILEDYHVFGSAEVEAFAKVYFSDKGKQEELHSILDGVVTTFLDREQEEQENFRKHVVDYVRLYSFLSQLLTFTDIDLEKLYQFARFLRRKLPVTRERLPVEITENINLDSYRIQQTSTGAIVVEVDGELKPISDLGTGKGKDEKTPLSEIVQYINENYGTDFTTEDKVRFFAEDMERRLVKSEGLTKALDPTINPSPENRKLAFDHLFTDILEDMFEANADIYKKIVDDESFGDLFRVVMFKKIEAKIAELIK
jgi:type I restriction enzyme R subunit